MLIQIVKDYRMIYENLDKLIKLSGFRVPWIQEQMGMSDRVFYNRRKNMNFSFHELENLLTIIRTEEILEEKLLEMSENAGNLSEKEKRVLLRKILG